MDEVEKLTLASVCTQCNAELQPPARRNTIYLERSETNGRFYQRGALPPGHRSGGILPFCKSCAGTPAR